jgi:dTDP-4-dehydrorhamnose 3,5-epimerase
VRVVAGEVFDVTVDLRRRSPTFGRCAAFNLAAASRRIAWIPPGLAHGFYVVSDEAEVLYKTTDYYAPQHDRTLLWNDPELGIRWPLAGDPVLSDKDRLGVPLRNAELFD